MTPEGKVKRDIKRVLDAFGVYYFMPVQMGLGAAGVDFHCVVRVTYVVSGVQLHLPIAFFIEAKEEGKQPTARQTNFLRERREKQSCKTFVISDIIGLNSLAEWLETIEFINEHPDATLSHV